jgi:hypothetical protein
LHSCQVVLTLSAILALASCSPATDAIPAALTLTVDGTTTVAHTATDTLVVHLVRHQLAGNISVSAVTHGGPTVLVAPANTIADSVLLVADATDAAPGNYSDSVTATDGVVSVTQALPILVVPGNVTIDYSKCDASNTPTFFAYQDGAGPWHSLRPTNGTYNFNVASDRGAYATLGIVSTRAGLNVQAQPRDTLVLSSNVYCDAIPGPLKRITGSVIGITPPQAGSVSLGGSGLPVGGNTGVTFTNVPAGPVDLTGYRVAGTVPSALDRWFVRRDVNVPDAGTVGPIDFDGTESLPVVSGLVDVTGADGLPLDVVANFRSGASCADGLFTYHQRNMASPVAVVTLPVAARRPGDLYSLSLMVTDGTATRYVFDVSADPSGTTVSFGPNTIHGLSVTRIDGAYPRLSASFTRPVEYNGQIDLAYAGSSAGIGMTVGAGYPPIARVTMPDLSGLPGWQAGWLSTAGPLSWSVDMISSPSVVPSCASGTMRMLLTHGTI